MLSGLLFCLSSILISFKCHMNVFSLLDDYITGRSSQLFSYKTVLQSWLMFAQKYVIADFLLINRSRVQAAILPCYYYLCASWLMQPDER